MEYTNSESRNLWVVKRYMELSYSPSQASAQAVRHLVAEGSQFIAPSTFPEVRTSTPGLQELISPPHPL